MLIIHDRLLKHFLIMCFKRQIKIPFFYLWASVDVYKYHRIFHVITKQWKENWRYANYPNTLFGMLWGKVWCAIPQRREGNQDAPTTWSSIHLTEENLFDKLLLKYSKQWSRLDFISHASLTRLLIVLIFLCYVPKFWCQTCAVHPQSGTSTSNLIISMVLHRPHYWLTCS